MSLNEGRNRVSAVVGILGVLLLTAGIANAVFYYKANAHLVGILDELTGGRRVLTEGELSAVVARVHRRAGPETTLRMGGLDPLIPWLKASPVDVDRIGGHCGNLTRLTVSLLHLGGVDARKLHLYNPADAAALVPYVHAVVEADVGGRYVVVDPLYNIVYRNASGDLATLADLQSDLELVASQVPARYPLELYNFDDPRGIRWTIVPLGESVRSFLSDAFGDELVDGLHYPYVLERPYLVLALLYSVLGSAGIAFFCVGRRRCSLAPSSVP